MNNGNHEVMTVDEVAAYLRCHPSTIYRMLRRKELPAFKIGSDWRFPREQIEAYVRNATELGR